MSYMSINVIFPVLQRKIAQEVRQLRHHFGLHLAHFLIALCHHPRAVCYALIGAHAHRMLVGACNPMLCPIHVFRSARTVWSTSGPLNSNQDLDPCHRGRDSHLRCWKINTVPRPGINDLRGEAADLAVWLDGILGGSVALLSVCSRTLRRRKVRQASF